MADLSAEPRCGRGLMVLLAAELLAVVALALAGAAGGGEARAALEDHRALVSHLGLTDLALGSGAGYCRHPSQADLFAPHGDHPGALERFPAGSIVPPRPAEEP